MGARHDDLASRFHLAPPRHFLLPAVLLLLSEEPSYGYNLVKSLNAFRFGPVDRPSVYRTLAQLERDELVESWPGPSTAGQERRVYGLTPKGDRALRTWMGVIKEERDGLDRVLRRYAATGTPDAVLAEAEGELGRSDGLSAVASSMSLGPLFRVIGRPEEHPWARGPITDDARVQTYEVVSERSAVLIEARSTVGPITFGAVGLTGVVEAEMRGGIIWPEQATRARLDVPVTGLSSGNRLYDAELLRRIEARRHPIAKLELSDCIVVGSAGRYRVTGRLDFHGVVRSLEGTVTVDPRPDGSIVVTGGHAFDIRDFDIASPTVLMLRIYPDVTVKLQVEAVPVDAP
ncbi:MAG TPA: helix-turn-helix transcriptional regulator [Acidimicrobiales bacterium]|nr:helix-turn-helix transcriptional regulator [Acidimicrobiales bacterium]